MKKDTFIKSGTGTARKVFKPAVNKTIAPRKIEKKAGVVLESHHINGRALDFYYGKNLRVYWHIRMRRKIFNQMAEADGMPNLATAKRNYNSSNKAHRLFYDSVGEL